MNIYIAPRYLIQPSNVPGRNGIPWPMSPSKRSPSTSLSNATSVKENTHLQYFFTLLIILANF